MNLKLRSTSQWTCLLALLPIMAVAQVPSNPQPPVAYSSVSELNLLLSQLQQISQTTQADLGKTRVEKWKTDSNTKRQTQANMESIQRNLQSAMPEIINQLQASPENLNATFKLYRNLDALYDVLSSVVESAGAFGSKDEFQSLANDLSTLEHTRRSFADRLDTLSASKENELAQLRNQIKAAQAAAASAPPKKVVVDDTEPKKTTKKKSPSKSAKPSANSTGTQTPPQ
ncbi:MAG TPA: hypothetical protein VFA68_07935 [Terriglobales bacterium]|nr:hypothetical protein [Terriglobales bacterium]